MSKPRATTFDDALLRLGLALYRLTLKNGLEFYNVHDLIFEILDGDKPTSIFQRYQKGGDFWAKESALAKGLARAGIAEHHARSIPKTVEHSEEFIRLTPFGKALYEMAHAQLAYEGTEIEGLTPEDAHLVLKDEAAAKELATELGQLELNQLNLTNFERASAQSYINMMVQVCLMPDPDGGLFWKMLERANQFAGVAALIVSIIALRLAK